MNSIDIALKIVDFKISVEDLNKIVGLTPTDFHRIGDEYYFGLPKNGIIRKKENNFWEIRRVINNPKDWVQDYIVKFIDEIVIPNQKRIQKLESIAEIELYICIIYEKDERLESFHFNKFYLNKLNELKIDIDIEQYIE